MKCKYVPQPSFIIYLDFFHPKRNIIKIRGLKSLPWHRSGCHTDRPGCARFPSLLYFISIFLLASRCVRGKKIIWDFFFLYCWSQAGRMGRVPEPEAVRSEHRGRKVLRGRKKEGRAKEGRRAGRGAHAPRLGGGRTSLAPRSRDKALSKLALISRCQSRVRLPLVYALRDERRPYWEL